MKMWFWVIAGAAGIGAYYLLRKKKPVSTLPSSSSHRIDPVLPASPAPPKAALAPTPEWSGPAPRTPKAQPQMKIEQGRSVSIPPFPKPIDFGKREGYGVPQWQPGYLDPDQEISRYYPTPSRLNLNLGPAPSPRPMQPLPPEGFRLGPIIATTGTKG